MPTSEKPSISNLSTILLVPLMNRDSISLATKQFSLFSYNDGLPHSLPSIILYEMPVVFYFCLFRFYHTLFASTRVCVSPQDTYFM